MEMKDTAIGLVWLLRAAWVCGTLPILIASLPSSCFNSFHGLILGFAKRGKIMQPSSQKVTVPQKFFLHFYLLAVVWTTNLLGATWFYAHRMAPLGTETMDYYSAASHLTGGSHIFSLHKFHFTTPEHGQKVWQCVLLLLLLEIHVLRRLYETCYVFKYRSSARMHICGYLTGLFFYAAAPLSLCSFCALEVVNFTADQVTEFKVKGQEMLLDTEFDWWGCLKPITKLRWCQWVGVAIFAWGWVHQQRCHAILGSLREQRERTEEYVIPHGDWFELVSSPHYLAEMIIYLGLLVVSGGTDLTVWLLLGFVVANLAIAAAETQRWYINKFEDYPRERRAVLPLVY
ncbi:Steroid_dh domain-containing protein [Cephalotus follicularis]|uniref:Steroid_dh domain-containing protein n=1 Tax=Cephalotus follicularis TaxID=3775 RepID=A0A1Q3C6H4_CEPFO|nr:Steroid_dh domain-containing protein [Cephalotus follicularis]